MNNKISFSFDDNHKLNTRIADLFEKFGFKAVFFINIEPMRHHEQMTTEDIISLHKRGFEIGAHTWSHRPLPQLLSEQAYYEIFESKKQLEEMIGTQIHGFCYPKGQYNQHIISMVQRAGYTYARTTGEGNTDACEGSYEIKPTVQIYNSPLRRYLRIKNCIDNHLPFALSGDWLQSCKNFIEQSEGIIRIFGHSWEIEEQGQWEKLEELLCWIKENEYEVINEKDIHLILS